MTDHKREEKGQMSLNHFRLTSWLGGLTGLVAAPLLVLAVSFAVGNATGGWGLVISQPAWSRQPVVWKAWSAMPT